MSIDISKKKCLIVVHPMIFHRRVTDVNNARGGRQHAGQYAPIQIVQADGGMSIGIPLLNNVGLPDEQGSHIKNVVVTSVPVQSTEDLNYRLSLSRVFSIVFLFNIIVTSLLFSFADSVDTSLIQSQVESPPAVLQQISNLRQSNESTYFICTIIILSIGELSMLIQDALGISIFAVAIIFNFLFGQEGSSTTKKKAKVKASCKLVVIAIEISYIYVKYKLLKLWNVQEFERRLEIGRLFSARLVGESENPNGCLPFWKASYLDLTSEINSLRKTILLLLSYSGLTFSTCLSNVSRHIKGPNKCKQLRQQAYSIRKTMNEIIVLSLVNQMITQGHENENNGFNSNCKCRVNCTNRRFSNDYTNQSDPTVSLAKILGNRIHLQHKPLVTEKCPADIEEPKTKEATTTPTHKPLTQHRIRPKKTVHSVPNSLLHLSVKIIPRQEIPNSQLPNKTLSRDAEQLSI
eukprot:gene3604-7172_t